jgi:uroporphyrinogen-III synthase
MRILVTRPREDGAEIARLLSARGHESQLAPLLEPVFPEGPELGPELEGVTAILVTSANGIRALARRTVRRDLDIFAVGPQTESEARQAGFTQVRNADGDAKALARATQGWAPAGAHLLHVCSGDAPGTLADMLGESGYHVRRCLLYRIVPATSLPPEVKLALAQRRLDAAMFFSPRTARIFTDLAQGLPTGHLTALCISRATADALPPHAFAGIRIAARPNQDAMLALASAQQ